MKKAILFLLIIVSSVPAVTAQNNQVKKNPTGSWKFEAPYAPEGYTTGSIVVGLAEKKYTASMVFDGNEYKFTGEKVKFENDSLFFLIYAEDQEVKFSFRLEDVTKMSGKAVYSEGELLFNLTKMTPAAEVKGEIKN